jgi:hypothetical protein
MVYLSESHLARTSHSRVIAAVGSVAAAIILVTGLLFYARLPQHEMINRAAKADAEVPLSELKAKLAVKVAWRRFFFDRGLADSSALNQFVGAEAVGAAKDRPSRIVVLSKGDSITIAW